MFLNGSGCGGDICTKICKIFVFGVIIVGEPLSKILENAYRLAIKILPLVWNSLRHSPHDRIWASSTSNWCCEITVWVAWIKIAMLLPYIHR